MTASLQTRHEAAMERLRTQHDTAFNPMIGERKVVFTVLIAEQSKIEPGKHFMVSHISNTSGWADQIAMAKAFIAKAEEFMAETGGVL